MSFWAYYCEHLRETLWVYDTLLPLRRYGRVAHSGSGNGDEKPWDSGPATTPELVEQAESTTRHLIQNRNSSGEEGQGDVPPIECVIDRTVRFYVKKTLARDI